MKIKGKTFDGPNIEVVVIPRQTGNIVFKAQAVLDYTDFEKLNPVPQAPKGMRPGGVEFENTEDPEYNKRLNEWAQSKSHYMIIKSLTATEDLEWETVKWEDPSTWGNYQQELKEAGFTQGEINRIIGIISNANGLNQDLIDEATKSFLAGPEAIQNEQ